MHGSVFRPGSWRGPIFGCINISLSPRSHSSIHLRWQLPFRQSLTIICSCYSLGPPRPTRVHSPCVFHDHSPWLKGNFTVRAKWTRCTQTETGQNPPFACHHRRRRSELPPTIPRRDPRCWRSPTQTPSTSNTLWPRRQPGTTPILRQFAMRDIARTTASIIHFP